MSGHHVHRVLRGGERRIRIGDIVAVFALGPIGLCAVAGAKLMGATTIIGVDTVPERLAMAKRLGADVLIDFKEGSPVEQITQATDGRGVDAAIEALGTQGTFELALRVLRPGGTLSSLGVYSTDLTIPLSAFTPAWGQSDRDHALPGWEGADASVDDGRRVRAGRSEATGHASIPARRH